MQYDPSNPLIVQGDRTVLVEVDNPKYAEARDALAPFAELEKSPEHIHTYRLTDLSLWNAAAAGVAPEAMIETLCRFGKYDMPENVRRETPAVETGEQKVVAETTVAPALAHGEAPPRQEDEVSQMLLGGLEEDATGLRN